MTDIIQAKKTAPLGYHYTNAGILPNEWTSRPLSSIVEEIAETAGTRKIETVSISAGVGFVNQAEKFGKELSGKQYEKYTVLHRGDFSYNKGNSTLYPQGCIYRLNDRTEAAVPNVFESFRVSDGNPDFYEQLFISGFLNRQLYYRINRGVRDDGLLTLRGKDFYSCEVPCPPLAEQERIAEILMQCDKVIELKLKRIEEEKKKKKWLMHYFFGNKSVAGWSAARYSDVCDLLNGRAYKQEELLASGAYLVLRVGNLFTKGDWYYSDLELSEDKYIDNGDLIYAWSASFGPRIWTGGKVIYHYHIWKVVPKNSIDKDYLYQYFLYDVELLAKEQQGGTMSHITKEMMEKRECRFPEFDRQKEIAQTLSQLDEHIRLLEKECDAWMLKKKALMQLLLTGIVRAKV